MNAGRDYTRAKRHAQANANGGQTPWKLFAWGQDWWIEPVSPDVTLPLTQTWAGVTAEIIEPADPVDATDTEYLAYHGQKPEPEV